MRLRQIVKAIPFAAEAKRWLDSKHQGLRHRSALSTLRAHPAGQGAQIAEALSQLGGGVSNTDKRWIGRIEAERSRLLAIDDPLCDDTLGEVDYDKGRTVAEACEASKPPVPALFLYLLVRSLKPRNVLEMGTNLGVSGAYIAAALKENDQGGSLVTLEGSPYRQRIARDMHCSMGLDNVSYVKGLFADTLTPTLNDMGSVDLAFVDGNHWYEPTMEYFEEITLFSARGTTFVFDDIRWSEGMSKAWADLKKDQRLDPVVDLGSVGLGVLGGEADRKSVLGPLRVF